MARQDGLSIHSMQADQGERCFSLDILHDLVIQVRTQILVVLSRPNIMEQPYRGLPYVGGDEL